MQTKHVGFRIPVDDLVLMREVCNARGEDVSDFVRRAIRKELAELSFLSDYEKKALGVFQVSKKEIKARPNPAQSNQLRVGLGQRTPL